MTVAMLGMLLFVATLLCMSSAQDSPRNVALHKRASQSSTFDGTDIWATPNLTYRASADLAVDGAPNKNYLNKTCAVTDWKDHPHCTDNPWWQVDLGELYDVFNVTIYQRGEGESGKVNHGPLVVHIGDHVERPENRKDYYDRPVVPIPLSSPVTASTVNISITGCSILQLCEVEVFAVIHVNECTSTLCQHGGSCTDGLFSYTCTCVSGYTGVSCETDVNECDSSPCTHESSCQDFEGSFECGCLPGYSGTRCETDINECASSPCTHGNCTDGVNSYNCTCLPGYTGSDCLHDIDECASNQCLEGATCHNYLNSYNCTCAAGFTGQNCGTNIDDCANSPCLHNASCKDGINSYTCQCAAGYTGSNCSDACSGGYYGPGCNSTCSLHCLESSDRGGQHCYHTSGQCLLQTGCKDDFQGDRCDMKQPQAITSAPVPAPSATSRASVECGGVVCDNGGVCKMTPGGSTCVCSPGYTGLSCHSKCQTGLYGLECSQTCPSCEDGYGCHYVHGACPPKERYAEGVGTGLGIGLGTSLLLALGIFALLRCRRRGNPSSEKASTNSFPMSSRQAVAVSRQQGTASRGQEADPYESLDDATKDRGQSSPYSELEGARRGQEGASPYSYSSESA